MKIDQNKLARQQEIINKWIKTNGKGTLEAVTGFGKSYVGVLAMQVTQKKDPNRVIHIVVPGNDIKSQWERELITHGIVNAEVFTIHSYIGRLRYCSLLILDEIHNYAAPTFKQVFEVTRYSFVLGLTATLERRDGKHFLLQEKAPVLDVVTLAEARREEYISDFIVYNLAMELSPSDKEDYDKLHKTFNKLFGRFGYNFDMMLRCSFGKAKGGEQARLEFARSRGWHPGRDGINHQWSPQNVGKYAQQGMAVMRKRKNYLYSAPSKVEMAARIIEKFPGAKVITFSQTTEFADQLSARLGKIARAYHTNLETIIVQGKKMGKTKRKREALRLFNDGRSKVRVLSTAKALDEGFDAPDIDLAIICSGSSVARQSIQRLGRAVRFKPGKRAIVVNLYLKDTQDAKWLKSRTKTTVNMVNVYEIDEIGLSRDEIAGYAAPDEGRQRPLFTLDATSNS